MFISIRSKLSSFWMAAASVVVGLLLLLFPSISFSIFSTGLGIALILYGLTYLFRFWQEKRQGISANGELFLGLIVIIFGLLFLSVPKIIASILPFILGALLLLSGLFKIPDAWEAFRSGVSCRWLFLFATLVPLVLGIILLFNPFGVITAVISFFGICLMANGLLDLFSFFLSRKELKK